MSEEKNNKPAGLAEEKLREFATNLVKQKNFQGLDGETFNNLVDDVYDRLEERVNAVIMANLPPEKLEDLDKLMESGSKEELSDFCEKNVPNLQNVITEALVEFQKTYMGVA